MSKEITIGELNIYREKYISKFLQSEVGELNDLHKNVIKSITGDKSLLRLSWGCYTTPHEIEQAFDYMGEIHARLSRNIR